MCADQPELDRLRDEVLRLRARVAELEAAAREARRSEAEAAAELRRQGNLAREYLNIAGVMLLVLDREGKIVLMNRRGHEILGYPEGELLSKDWFDTCLPEHARGSVREAFRRIMAGELEAFGRVENPVLARSGEERIIAWHNTVLTDEQGNRTGTLSSGEDVTERKRAEEALRRSHQELEARVQERTADLARANERLQREVAVRAEAEAALRRGQRVLEQLLESSDRERMVVAYEIHDGLAQDLAAARMQLEALRQKLAARPQEAPEALDAVAEQLERAMREARRLVHGLRPLEVDEAGVAAAIGQLVGEAAAAGGPAVEFHHRLDSPHLPRLVENTLLRAAQEGLANARRHSRSDKVRVDLVQHGGTVRLQIRDWGCGFDPDEVREGSFGLEGIRQRARMLGGQARIESAPGRGTSVTVDLPLSEAERR